MNIIFKIQAFIIFTTITSIGFNFGKLKSQPPEKP